MAGNIQDSVATQYNIQSSSIHSDILQQFIQQDADSKIDRVSRNNQRGNPAKKVSTSTVYQNPAYKVEATQVISKRSGALFQNPVYEGSAHPTLNPVKTTPVSERVELRNKPPEEAFQTAPNSLHTYFSKPTDPASEVASQPLLSPRHQALKSFKHQFYKSTTPSCGLKASSFGKQPIRNPISTSSEFANHILAGDGNPISSLTENDDEITRQDTQSSRISAGSPQSLHSVDTTGSTLSHNNHNRRLSKGGGALGSDFDQSASSSEKQLSKVIEEGLAGQWGRYRKQRKGEKWVRNHRGKGNHEDAKRHELDSLLLISIDCNPAEAHSQAKNRVRSDQRPSVQKIKSFAVHVGPLCRLGPSTSKVDLLISNDVSGLEEGVPDTCLQSASLIVMLVDVSQGLNSLSKYSTGHAACSLVATACANICRMSHVSGVMLQGLDTLLSWLSGNEMYRFMDQLRRSMPQELLLMVTAEGESLEHVVDHVDGAMLTRCHCSCSRHATSAQADQYRKNVELLKAEALVRASFMWFDVRGHTLVRGAAMSRAYMRFLAKNHAIGWVAPDPRSAKPSHVKHFYPTISDINSGFQVYQLSDMQAVVSFLAVQIPPRPNKSPPLKRTINELLSVLSFPQYVQLDESDVDDKSSRSSKSQSKSRSPKSTASTPRSGHRGCMPWGPLTLDESVLVHLAVTPRISFALFSQAQLNLHTEPSSISQVRSLLSYRVADLLHHKLPIQAGPPVQSQPWGPGQEAFQAVLDTLDALLWRPTPSAAQLLAVLSSSITALGDVLADLRDALLDGAVQLHLVKRAALVLPDYTQNPVLGFAEASQKVVRLVTAEDVPDAAEVALYLYFGMLGYPYEVCAIAEMLPGALRLPDRVPCLKLSGRVQQALEVGGRDLRVAVVGSVQKALNGLGSRVYLSLPQKECIAMYLDLLVEVTTGHAVVEDMQQVRLLNLSTQNLPASTPYPAQPLHTFLQASLSSQSNTTHLLTFLQKLAIVLARQGAKPSLATVAVAAGLLAALRQVIWDDVIADLEFTFGQNTSLGTKLLLSSVEEVGEFLQQRYGQGRVEEVLGVGHGDLCKALLREVQGKVDEVERCVCDQVKREYVVKQTSGMAMGRGDKGWGGTFRFYNFIAKQQKQPGVQRVKRDKLSTAVFGSVLAQRLILPGFFLVLDLLLSTLCRSGVLQSSRLMPHHQQSQNIQLFVAIYSGLCSGLAMQAIVSEHMATFNIGPLLQNLPNYAVLQLVGPIAAVGAGVYVGLNCDWLTAGVSVVYGSGLSVMLSLMVVLPYLHVGPTLGNMLQPCQRWTSPFASLLLSVLLAVPPLITEKCFYNKKYSILEDVSPKIVSFSIWGGYTLVIYTCALLLYFVATRVLSLSLNLARSVKFQESEDLWPLLDQKHSDLHTLQAQQPMGFQIYRRCLRLFYAKGEHAEVRRCFLCPFFVLFLGRQHSVPPLVRNRVLQQAQEQYLLGWYCDYMGLVIPPRWTQEWDSLTQEAKTVIQAKLQNDTGPTQYKLRSAVITQLRISMAVVMLLLLPISVHVKIGGYDEPYQADMVDDIRESYALASRWAVIACLIGLAVVYFQQVYVQRAVQLFATKGMSFKRLATTKSRVSQCADQAVASVRRLSRQIRSLNVTAFTLGLVSQVTIFGVVFAVVYYAQGQTRYHFISTYGMLASSYLVLQLALTLRTSVAELWRSKADSVIFIAAVIATVANHTLAKLHISEGMQHVPSYVLGAVSILAFSTYLFVLASTSTHLQRVLLKARHVQVTLLNSILPRQAKQRLKFHSLSSIATAPSVTSSLRRTFSTASEQRRASVEASPKPLSFLSTTKFHQRQGAKLSQVLLSQAKSGLLVSIQLDMQTAVAELLLHAIGRWEALPLAHIARIALPNANLILSELHQKLTQGQVLVYTLPSGAFSACQVHQTSLSILSGGQLIVFVSIMQIQGRSSSVQVIAEACVGEFITSVKDKPAWHASCWEMLVAPVRNNSKSAPTTPPSKGSLSQQSAHWGESGSVSRESLSNEFDDKGMGKNKALTGFLRKGTGASGKPQRSVSFQEESLQVGSHGQLCSVSNQSLTSGNFPYTFTPQAPLRLRLQAQSRTKADEQQLFLNAVRQQQCMAMGLNLTTPYATVVCPKQDGKFTQKYEVSSADREWLAGVTIGWSRMSDHLFNGADLNQALAALPGKQLVQHICKANGCPTIHQAIALCMLTYRSMCSLGEQIVATHTKPSSQSDLTHDISTQIRRMLRTHRSRLDKLSTLVFAGMQRWLAIPTCATFGVELTHGGYRRVPRWMYGLQGIAWEPVRLVYSKLYDVDPTARYYRDLLLKSSGRFVFRSTGDGGNLPTAVLDFLTPVPSLYLRSGTGGWLVTYRRYNMPPGLASQYLAALPQLPLVEQAVAELLHYDRSGRLLYREPPPSLQNQTPMNAKVKGNYFKCGVGAGDEGEESESGAYYMYMYAQNDSSCKPGLADLRVKLSGPYWKEMEDAFQGLEYTDLLQLFHAHFVMEVMLYKKGMPQMRLSRRSILPKDLEPWADYSQPITHYETGDFTCDSECVGSQEPASSKEEGHSRSCGRAPRNTKVLQKQHQRVRRQSQRIKMRQSGLTNPEQNQGSNSDSLPPLPQPQMNAPNLPGHQMPPQFSGLTSPEEQQSNQTSSSSAEEAAVQPARRPVPIAEAAEQQPPSSPPSLQPRRYSQNLSIVTSVQSSDQPAQVVHYSPRSDMSGTSWPMYPGGADCLDNSAPLTPQGESHDVVLQQAFIYSSAGHLQRSSVELLMGGGDWSINVNYVPTNLVHSSPVSSVHSIELWSPAGSFVTLVDNTHPSHPVLESFCLTDDGQPQESARTPHWIIHDRFHIINSEVRALLVEDVLGGGVVHPLFGSLWPTDSLKAHSAVKFGLDATPVWRQELWAAQHAGLVPPSAATTIDRRTLQRHPLLKKYWARHKMGAGVQARNALLDVRGEVDVLMRPPCQDSSRSLLVYKADDLKDGVEGGCALHVCLEDGRCVNGCLWDDCDDDVHGPGGKVVITIGQNTASGGGRGGVGGSGEVSILSKSQVNDVGSLRKSMEVEVDTIKTPGGVTGTLPAPYSNNNKQGAIRLAEKLQVLGIDSSGWPGADRCGADRAQLLDNIGGALWYMIAPCSAVQKTPPGVQIEQNIGSVVVLPGCFTDFRYTGASLVVASLFDQAPCLPRYKSIQQQALAESNAHSQVVITVLAPAVVTLLQVGIVGNIFCPSVLDQLEDNFLTIHACFRHLDWSTTWNHPALQTALFSACISATVAGNQTGPGGHELPSPQNIHAALSWLRCSLQALAVDPEQLSSTKHVTHVSSVGLGSAAGLVAKRVAGQSVIVWESEAGRGKSRVGLQNVPGLAALTLAQRMQLGVWGQVFVTQIEYASRLLMLCKADAIALSGTTPEMVLLDIPQTGPEWDKVRQNVRQKMCSVQNGVQGVAKNGKSSSQPLVVMHTNDCEPDCIIDALQSVEIMMETFRVDSYALKIFAPKLSPQGAGLIVDIIEAKNLAASVQLLLSFPQPTLLQEAWAALACSKTSSILPFLVQAARCGVPFVSASPHQLPSNLAEMGLQVPPNMAHACAIAQLKILAISDEVEHMVAGADPTSAISPPSWKDGPMGSLGGVSKSRVASQMDKQPMTQSSVRIVDLVSKGQVMQRIGKKEVAYLRDVLSARVMQLSRVVFQPGECGKGHEQLLRAWSSGGTQM